MKIFCCFEDLFFVFSLRHKLFAVAGHSVYTRKKGF